MPKEFSKQILAPRTFHVKKLDGTRIPVSFTKERIANFVATHKAMTEGADPLSVPAPWQHDDSAPLLQKNRAAGSRANAGWWKRFEQHADGTLHGILESDLSDRAIALESQAAAIEADAARPDKAEAVQLRETAKQLRLEEEKIGTTVRAVSPLIKDKYVDGLGREWSDVITHVALVTKPVQPGQDNFQPVDGTPVLAMSEDGLESVALADTPVLSGKVPQNASSTNFTDCLKALESVGLKLPVDTVLENLVERIITASVAIDGTKEDDEDDPPPGTQVNNGPTPVALSETEIMANEHLTKAASNIAKANYKTRIDRLIEAGTIGPDYAKKHLTPLVEGYALSMDDEGAPVPMPIDTKLEALEALPATGTSNVLKKIGKPTRNGIQKVALGEDFQENELAEPDEEESTLEQDGIKQGEAARNAELKRRGLSVPTA